jgi:predicted aldo/keto reductase-like oxidoreductase
VDPRWATSRRGLLTAGGLLAAGALAARSRAVLAAPEEEAAPVATLPRRPLGKTGFRATVFGLGCFPLGKVPEEDAAIAVVKRALEAGCNYLDTAPSYGRSEERVGQALKGCPRDRVFLSTKTHTRTAAEARRDLEGSLRRLGVERIDMVQVHAITDADDFARVREKGGVLAELEKARGEGLVRFVGATGHFDPEVMKTVATSELFDAVLFPLNCVDVHHLSFVKTTLPAAAASGVARIAMKVFASGNLVARGVDPSLCLRFTYGLDVSTAIVGCQTVEEVDLAVRVARENRPLAPDEERALFALTEPHQGKAVEWYKRN